MKTWLGSKRRGVTLVLVMIIGVIVAILATSMVQLGYHARMLAVRNVEGIAARTAADAGIADGLFWMQKKLVNDAVWDESVFPRSSTGTLAGTQGQFNYTTSVLTSRTRFQIASTGTCRPATKIVTAVLAVGSYWTGVGVQQNVTVNVDATFAGPIEIRSNTTTAGAMVFKAGVYVPGDVVCGPGGNPDTVLDIKKTTIITGDTYAAAEPLDFPPVTAPSPLPPTQGDLKKSATLGTAGTYQYDSISLPNGSLLEISAPVVIYVAQDMTLKNGAEVRVDAGGSLTLYLHGNLDAKNGTGFTNNTNDPTKLKIYGLPTCSQIDLKAKSGTHAAVYAPSAAVNLYNGASFYGALVGNSFTMKNSGTFGYDAALATVEIDDMAAAFNIQRWSEN